MLCPFNVVERLSRETIDSALRKDGEYHAVFDKRDAKKRVRLSRGNKAVLKQFEEDGYVVKIRII